MNLQLAKEELNALLKEKSRIGRFFYTLIPGILGLVLIILTLLFNGMQSRLGAFLLSGLLLCWSLGTALKIIPNPGPPTRWWRGYERIKYLEGFLHAPTEAEQGKKL